MNDLTVIQASQVGELSPSRTISPRLPCFQGLCAYVLKTVDNAARRGVVVGHDHRHHSEHWAMLTAAAFLARGMKVYLFRGLVHTPLYVPALPFLTSQITRPHSLAYLSVLGRSEQLVV